jgi:hypothetical protein
MCMHVCVMRFAFEFWSDLHAALGNFPDFRFSVSQQYIRMRLACRRRDCRRDRSFIDDLRADWPSLIPLLEFAIHDWASALVRGCILRRPQLASLEAYRASRDPQPQWSVGRGPGPPHVSMSLNRLCEQVVRKDRLDWAPSSQCSRLMCDAVLLDTSHNPLPSPRRQPHALLHGGPVEGACPSRCEYLSPRRTTDMAYLC